MSAPSHQTLRVVLEDAGDTSWGASLLRTLASQYGNTQLRFVGEVDGEKRYRSATFPAARTVNAMPPEEEWAPGMRRSLQELVAEIESDGWVQVAQGPEPWTLTFRQVPESGSQRQFREPT
jgi:hypothetical protein